MNAPQQETKETLIAELERAVRSGSADLRVKKLREVSALFLAGASSLTDEQIDVFDDVMCQLMIRIENAALAELGKVLAPVDHAPAETIRRLAWNSEIAVAGPILTGSKRLADADLVEIAEVRGQQHLMAISRRETLATPVTDVLLRRGDGQVIQTLAGNAGARFSEAGYATLVENATDNETLSEIVGSRSDIPTPLLRRVLERATDAVRAKLLALLPPERYDHVVKFLSQLTTAMAGTDDEYAGATKTIALLDKAGRLNDGTIRDFASAHQLREVIVALSVLNSTKTEVIANILNGARNDAVLVPCKAAGLSWETVEAILRNRHARQPISSELVDLAHTDYRRLSVETAQKTLRFMQVRALAS